MAGFVVQGHICKTISGALVKIYLGQPVRLCHSGSLHKNPLGFYIGSWIKHH